MALMELEKQNICVDVVEWSKQLTKMDPEQLVSVIAYESIRRVEAVMQKEVESLERVLKLNRPDCPFYTTCTPGHRCPGCGGYND